MSHLQTSDVHHRGHGPGPNETLISSKMQNDTFSFVFSVKDALPEVFFSNAFFFGSQLKYSHESLQCKKR